MIGIETAKLCDLDLGRFERAEITITIEQLKEDLANETKGKSIDNDILEMYLNFEELCFNMEKASGIRTMEDIKRMNIYDFYTYKKMLKKSITPNNKEDV
jgi:hypothetical protein